MKTTTRVMCTVALLAGSWTVSAQQAAEGFKPFDENAPRETLPAAPLVYVAYSVAWLALAFYVFSLMRKLSRLETDLAELKRGPR